MQDYLRVSLRQIILLLTDLERATQALDRRATVLGIAIAVVVLLILALMVFKPGA